MKFLIAFAAVFDVFTIMPILRQTKMSIFGVLRNVMLAGQMLHLAVKEKGFMKHWQRQFSAVLLMMGQ
jgi:hypothetical protein